MHILCKNYLLQMTEKFHQIIFTPNFQISEEKNTVPASENHRFKGNSVSKILGPWANYRTVTLCGLELS